MSNSNKLKSFTIATLVCLISAVFMAPIAGAASNPFGMSDLDSGYMVSGEGKCGEGKEKGEGKCGEGKEKGKEKGEGKCGEGKGKGEGKCGGDKKEAGEKKCG